MGTDGEIKDGHSSITGDIGHTKHTTKKKAKTKNPHTYIQHNAEI